MSTYISWEYLKYTFSTYIVTLIHFVSGQMFLVFLERVALEDLVWRQIRTLSAFVDEFAGMFARLDDMLAQIVDGAALEVAVGALVGLLARVA